MKRYISSLLLGLLVIVASSCEEDNHEDGFFSVVDKWAVIGPSTVDAGSVVEYRTRFESGVSYTWTLPAGATVTSTYPATHYRIEVQMAANSGDVAVSGAGLESGSMAVTVETNKPELTTSLSSTGTGFLIGGSSDTVYIESSIPLATAPTISLAAVDDLEMGSLSALTMTDDQNFYTIYTAASGNGIAELILEGATTTALYGSTVMDKDTSAIYTVDNTAPVASISASENFVRANNAVTITADFGEMMESSSTVQISATVNGSALVTNADMTVDADDSGIWTYTLIPGLIVNGAIEITISGGADMAGNTTVATNASDFLFLDNLAPTINTNSEMDNGSAALLSARYTETSLGYTVYYAVLESGSTAPSDLADMQNASFDGLVGSGNADIAFNADGASFSVTLATGTYDVYYIAVDKAGNASGITATSVTMD